MLYSISYQQVLPPWLVLSQDIDASSENEAKQIFKAQHPYNDYAEEIIIKIEESK
jgi:hypothetical protein